MMMKREHDRGPQHRRRQPREKGVAPDNGQPHQRRPDAETRAPAQTACCSSHDMAANSSPTCRPLTAMMCVVPVLV